MYGQYSNELTSGRKLSLGDQAPEDAVKVERPKTCTPHNRAVATYSDGRRDFILHKTAVVAVDPEGNVTLDDGGWATMTTRRAMMEGLKELADLDYAVWGGNKKMRHVLIRYTDEKGREEIYFNCPFTFKPEDLNRDT